MNGVPKQLYEWWTRFTALTDEDLPRARVVGSGAALFCVIFAVLVTTAINGTSSGAFFAMMYAGSDPALLFGTPNLIRTDEWNVQTVWAIAQVQQGLPVINGTFPGGMDATIPQDLPRIDWSAVFRPHLWGFQFFDVDHAQAWKWWLPLLGVAIATYTFVIVEMPRRPLLAALSAVAVSASPFLQWWFLQTTLWPLAWGFATLAAVRWSLRTSRSWHRWIWASVIMYLTVVMAMGIYVPYIVPVVIITALTAIGMIIAASPGLRWPTVILRLVPLLVGGVVAGMILIVWLITRWSTVTAFLSTAYPGERLVPTGLGASLQSIAALFGSSFTASLQNAGRFLDGNASESATFFLPAVFLLPVIVWVVVRAWRSRRADVWPLLLAVVGGIVLLAYIAIPGWDAVAHLLLLDRSTPVRARIGLGFGSFVVVILLLGMLSRRNRPGWLVAALGAVAFIASQAAIAGGLAVYAPDLLQLSGPWWFITIVSALAIFAVGRAWPITAMAALAAVGLIGSFGVNPLYRGVFDLRDTAPAQAIMQINDQHPGTWVAVGDRLTTALVLESGVTAYNGFQGAPNPEMWEQIDPTSTYAFEWDRLAGVSWVPGPGAPVITNPYPDQIQVTFDACSEFAQENVQYVASDSAADLNQRCLVKLNSLPVASTDVILWEVVSPPD
ncbi:MAG: hypothetical protein CME84_12160 [Henriciella sp.]|mgnify:CR=1 FL=1|nr:hypothetical protein [Henriciella sp.]